MNKKILIFKNDRIGDLIWSLEPINYLINLNKNNNITVFLSQINFSMNFLIKKKNIKFNQIDYHPTLIDRVKIFFYILFNNVDEIYIFRPQNFYFILAFIFYFKKTKFLAYCINDVNGYKRPNPFLRKFLFRYVVNDRSTKKIREHTTELQKKLVNFKSDISKKINFISNNYQELPDNYILFQFKKNMFESLNWTLINLEELIFSISKIGLPIIIIKDKEIDNYNDYFSKMFNYVDFKKKKVDYKGSNIFFVDNVEGKNYFNVIYNSMVTIAPHGTVTSISNLKNKLIIDLFYLGKNKISFYQAKNNFHEFKPKNDNYKFILVDNNFHKCVKKIKNLLEKYFQYV